MNAKTATHSSFFRQQFIADGLFILPAALIFTFFVAYLNEKLLVLA